MYAYPCAFACAIVQSIVFNTQFFFHLLALYTYADFCLFLFAFKLRNIVKIVCNISVVGGGTSETSNEYSHSDEILLMLNDFCFVQSFIAYTLL